MAANYSPVFVDMAAPEIRPANNAEQVSIEPATPDEDRRILGLKGLDKVNW